MPNVFRSLPPQIRGVAGFLFLLLALTARLCLAADPPKGLLVEAESFADKGGWVVDQQFMDQMGSPYLLAHGMGRPVADAKQTTTFPKTGTYRLWVRTWNWAAPWTTEPAPGQFQVRVEGKPLDRTFGTEGAEWGWRDG
ncbi:MAG TPA: NADH-dependent oxidoreductase, partial [Candidatus Sumerlaeota bacterium]|nr:NADH-dependent oxidoreductase [Candidatus Sumerlaeota bacterium]